MQRFVGGSRATDKNNKNSKEGLGEVREGKEFERVSKQVKIRNSTYYRLLALGITQETVDSIITRALRIAEPVMKETQARLYKDMASFGVTA
jgi:hypothetical protein